MKNVFLHFLPAGGICIILATFCVPSQQYAAVNYDFFWSSDFGTEGCMTLHLYKYI
jgi:hypothetical protein